MKDIAFIASIVFTLSVIDHLFGRAVGLAVSATALIACLLFLWHAGASSATADDPADPPKEQS